MNRSNTCFNQPFNNDSMAGIAYKAYLSGLAEENKNVVFHNSGPKHAAAVMSVIFQHSKEVLRIFAGTLAGDVSSDDNYKRSLDKYLRNGGKLEILLQKYDTRKPIHILEILRFYKRLDPEKVSIRKHSKKLKVGGGDEVHFCTADGKMHRIETDTVNYLAQGNFNDPVTAKQLDAIFCAIFNDKYTEEIDIFRSELALA